MLITSNKFVTIDGTRGNMEILTHRNGLDAILGALNTGALARPNGSVQCYGSDEHIAALDEIAAGIKAVRKMIALERKRQSDLEQQEKTNADK